MNILFVCKGNIGRSQMAEALFKQLNTEHAVMSAGTIVSADGEKADGMRLKDIIFAGNVILSLQEKGIDVADNVRTQLTPELLDWADKAIVMAEPETIPEYLEHSPKMEYWEISNPKGMNLNDHRDRINQIEVLVKKLYIESA